MKVAILGYGTVGQGVYEILSDKQKESSTLFSISHILIRSNKPKTLSIMCDDIDVILTDKVVDIVIEVMGGIEPAYTYIMRALKAKKHVVTANKAVVAKYLHEFLETAKANNVNFMFEASTAGGVPWIQAIQKVKRVDHVYSIEGIFNGTTNYILDQMLKYGLPFETALKQAQDLGYAESDPTADIDGIDICNKLKISIALAFGILPPKEIATFGIRTIRKCDIEYFKSIGKIVKLMAFAHVKDTTGSCGVEPMLFPSQSIEANVPDNYNLACIYGDTVGELKFYGQGAGKLPTANAVVQDMLDILEDKPQPFKLDKSNIFNDMKDNKTYVIRSSLDNETFMQIFPHVKQRVIYKKQIYRYITNLNTMQAHKKMTMLRTIDPNAFLASIKEDIV